MPINSEQHSALESILRDLPLPEGFREMIDRLGAHGAICEYLRPDGPFPEHLMTLHREGKLPKSIESLVLQPEWKEFFDEPLLIEASTRLQEVVSAIG